MEKKRTNKNAQAAFSREIADELAALIRQPRSMKVLFKTRRLYELAKGNREDMMPRVYQKFDAAYQNTLNSVSSFIADLERGLAIAA